MKESAVTDDGVRICSTKSNTMQLSLTSDMRRQKTAVKYNKLLRDIAILTLENGMFQRYIDRVGLSKFVFRSSGGSVSSSIRAMSRIICHWSEASSFGASGKVVRLNAERKCQIAKEEQLEFRKYFSLLREKSEGLIDETRDICLHNMTLENRSLTELRDKLLRHLDGPGQRNTVTAIDISEIKVRWQAALQEFKRLNLQCIQAKRIFSKCTRKLDMEMCKLKEVVNASAEVSARANRRVRTSNKLIARIDGYQDNSQLDNWRIRRLKSLIAWFNVPKLDDFIVSVKENEKVHRQLATENRKMRLAKTEVNVGFAYTERSVHTHPYVRFIPEKCKVLLQD
ncbi:hypothetical protein T265_01019 [Opisthorchis viverrini]|uniref:DUF4201 domain-containing protein n=1 Tax=Opisthorchis viverrini TaxID=6198 RepID=A0A075ABD7_OPIVI|nr:hypothetical protein T265_01019 [Opisthorchis viverrini]KER33135.1 hypothetical protein T265_01019 [Opisthorchis viverrini]